MAKRRARVKPQRRVVIPELGAIERKAEKPLVTRQPSHESVSSRHDRLTRAISEKREQEAASRAAAREKIRGLAGLVFPQQGE